MEMGVECMLLNGEAIKEVDCLSTFGRKWKRMKDVKGIWYTK